MSGNNDERLANALLIFAPERWGQVERFANLHSGTYSFSAREGRALSGVTAHFDKAQIFLALSEELKSGLILDRDELNAQGFTPAHRSRKMAAVVEAFVTELYSTVDCTAQVLRAVFGRDARGFRSSTSYLFTNWDKIDGLPQEITDAIREAEWYLPLRYLRDELTHCATGHCRLDSETGLVGYAHFGMKKDDKPLIYDDILHTMKKNLDAVNVFLGQIFHHLVSTLGDTPVSQMCGMTRGRILMRDVVPTEPLSFDSGTCKSFEWFELPENPDCPFAADCGAYTRTKDAGLCEI